MSFLNRITAIFLAFAYMQTGFGQAAPSRNNNDTTYIGKPTSASNKRLIFDKSGTNDGEIRFNTTTGKLEYTNDGTIFSSIGSGSGGGVNYFKANPDFESGATGYNTYKNTASAAPTNGTGGAPTVTFTRTTTTPLRGTASGLLTKTAANLQGEGFSYDFTVDTPDLGKTITFSFDYSNSANYTGSAGSEDVQVYIYDVTNAVLLPGSYDMPAGKGTLSGFFSSGTNGSVYRLIANVAGVGTSAWTSEVDNFQAGTQAYQLSASMQDWTNVTMSPSAGFGTVTNAVYQRKIVGDTAFYRGYFRVGTTTAANGGIDLPVGDVIDVTKTQATAGAQYVGLLKQIRTATGPASDQPFLVFLDAINNGTVYFTTQSGSNIFTKQAASSQLALNDGVSFEFSVPLTRISSNSIVANRALEEYASNYSTSDAGDTTSFTSGANGSLVPNTLTNTRLKRLQFQSSIQSTDTIQIELSFKGTGPWVKIAEYTAADVMPLTYGNVTNYGMALQAVTGSTTQMDVYFGQYAQNYSASTYGGAGASWGTAFSNGTRYRVRKITGGASVGYPVGSRNITGDITGTTIPVGIIGEVIQSLVTTPLTLTTNAQIYDLTSITLTAGNYLLNAFPTFISTTNGVVTVVAGISTTAGNSSTGLTNGTTQSQVSPPNATYNQTAPIQSYPVTVPAGTAQTWYLKVQAQFTGTAPTSVGRLTAIRIN